MGMQKTRYYFDVKILKKIDYDKTARHQLMQFSCCLATSAIASPALSQESPRRANPPLPRKTCVAHIPYRHFSK